MTSGTGDEEITVTTLRRDAVAVPVVHVRVTPSTGNAFDVPLGLDAIVIGSAPECDVVLDDKRVSRRHCTIALTERGVLVKDEASKNGVHIGTARVDSAIVNAGTEIVVGDSRIAIRVVAPPAEVALAKGARFGDFLGGTVQARALFAKLERAAPTMATILLEGESGSGKDLLARAIHDASTRREGPLVVFDCGAVSPTLIEAELFGHARGAFTGAIAERDGILEQARGGTLFLDEIGELPIDLQPKLLRALEAHEFRPVGGKQTRTFDARVIAATNRDLRARVARNEFRQDLYFRLAVVQARVPPLRERKEDIELIVDCFLAGETPPRTLRDLPPNTLALLRAYDWPGNVRELRNVVTRIALFRDASEAFDAPITDSVHSAYESDALDLPLREARDRAIERLERAYVIAKLAAAQGRVAQAADAAGVSRQFFYRLMERYGIRRDP